MTVSLYIVLIVIVGLALIYYYKNYEKKIYISAGTNCIAIKSKVPAPAIPAATVPNVVGMVLDAKNIADSPMSMIAL